MYLSEEEASVFMLIIFIFRVRICVVPHFILPELKSKNKVFHLIVQC